MVTHVCACKARYSLPDQLAGRQVRCTKCGQVSRVTAEPIIDLDHTLSLAVPEITRDLGGVTTPLLISAVSNIIIGVVFLSFCIGVLWLAVGMVEIFHYARSTSTPYPEYLAKSRSLSIAQIVFGIVNWFTLFCGIIIYIKTGELQRRIKVGS